MHETVGKIRILENSNFNLLGRMQGSRTETIFAKHRIFKGTSKKCGF